jgi:hypothetical protein
MGAVFRHKDFRREYNKKILKNAIRISARIRKITIKLLDAWEKRNDIKRKSDAIRRKAEGDPR